MAFLAVLAALIWLVEPDEHCTVQLGLERVVMFLGALAAFLSMEGASYFRSGRAKTHANDVSLLNKLFHLLPADRVVAFLREHDFGNTFLRSHTDPLLRFSDTWVGADKEFQDRAVEKVHKILVDKARTLARLIAVKTSPVGGDHQSVFAQNLRGQPRPDWVVLDAAEINQAADQFVTAYDGFVREARKRIELA